MKLFREAEIRKMLGWVTAEQISFSRMVEMMNEKADRKLQAKKQNRQSVAATVTMDEKAPEEVKTALVEMITMFDKSQEPV